MSDRLGEQLLANVMGWDNPPRPELIQAIFPNIELLSQYKFDAYQQFQTGYRFAENLARWLRQIDRADRGVALEFVLQRMVFISDAEFFHLVSMAYPDVIVPERERIVAEELGCKLHEIGKIHNHPRTTELSLKSLYLGLSDGARMSEFRRACGLQLYNDQVWQAYELGQEKARGLLDALGDALAAKKLKAEPRFTLVWLMDDFTASGNSYIRLEGGRFKGKLPKAYDTLLSNQLVDPGHYEVFVLFYVATRQAIDHIEYWCERYTSQYKLKPVQVRVVHTIDSDISLRTDGSDPIHDLIESNKYYDPDVESKATKVGGSGDVKWGFAECALPLVLCHNTPNNSIFLLWAPEELKFTGLFPRVSRHRDL